jgi:hypothetical protein
MILNIGIITWHYYSNIGSNLQAFALQKSLQLLGHNPEFINYRKPKYSDSFLKKICLFAIHPLYSFFGDNLPQKLQIGTRLFQKNYFNQSELISDPKKLKTIAHKYDAIICGSDQIWAPNVFDPTYMLDFVEDEVLKIAYAPSIGLDDIPANLISDYKKHLSRINFISVREKQGQRILKEYFNLDAEVVLDPSLLLPQCYWDDLRQSKSYEIKQEPYIFSYLLGDNDLHREYLKLLAKKEQKQIILYSENADDAEIADLHYRKLDPIKFLNLIYNASSVVTDSFHGITMSIVFEKNFCALYRFDEGDMLNQNSRVKNILETFELEGRAVTNYIPKEIASIDYAIINKKLSLEREKSINFLTEALRHG